jgi:Cu(I)/Ag(I) efflux system membrane fusion protein
MNRLAWIGLAAVVAGVGVAAGYWLGTRGPAQAPQAGAHGAIAGGGPEATKERKVLYYRNPMGLADTSPVPKKDPMGMDYVPVYEGDEADQKLPAGTVKIGLDKVQLLGVRSEAVQARELRRTVNAVGTIQANERLLYKVAPRFEGWIEKLHVNTTGQAVARGQPLMDVYSPELVTAQEEYLIALRGLKDAAASGPEAQAVMLRLSEGVQQRLRNWEISDEELQALRQEGKPRRLLTYRSSVSGVVLQKSGTQGMRFMPGEVLYEIADLSSLWMLAEVFEQELGLVRVGQEAKLRIMAYPDKAFAGKVVFIYPTIEPDTRTVRVRIELPNPGGLLKPAMYGSVELASGHGGGKKLAIPDSAVLDSGSRQVVLVRRGEGLFEPRRRLRRSDGRPSDRGGGRGARQLPDRRRKQSQGGARHLRRARRARRAAQARNREGRCREGAPCVRRADPRSKGYGRCRGCGPWHRRDHARSDPEPRLAGNVDAVPGEGQGDARGREERRGGGIRARAKEAGRVRDRAHCARECAGGAEGRARARQGALTC